jgi:hypothetical protein
MSSQKKTRVCRRERREIRCRSGRGKGLDRGIRIKWPSPPLLPGGRHCFLGLTKTLTRSLNQVKAVSFREHIL